MGERERKLERWGRRGGGGWEGDRRKNVIKPPYEVKQYLVKTMFTFLKISCYNQTFRLSEETKCS